MKKINNFSIKTSDLAATASSRQYTVGGEKDAEFILQIFNSDQEFYDFATKSFSTTFTSTSSLNVKMNSTSFNGNIKFPANASGDTYTILLLTPPDKETELTFGPGKNSYSTTITQVADAVDLIFTTVSGTSAAYGTPPTVTSTVSSISTAVTTKTINWTLTNSETEANGFGFRLIRQPIDTDWYFTTTETVNQPVDTGSTTEVVVDDLTDLCSGMYVTAGTGLSGTPTVTAIDIATKTLTLSTAQNFADGATLTFQARGGSIIKKAIGVDINFSEFHSRTTSTTAGPTPFTKTVRATGTNTVIALTDTYGLHGGGHIYFSGLNVVNTDANTIQSVVIDVLGTGSLDNDGTITGQVDQTAALAVGTTLHFKSVAVGETFGTQVKIDNTVSITTHPSTTRTIYLNLDNFITLGAAS